MDRAAGALTHCYSWSYRITSLNGVSVLYWASGTQIPTGQATDQTVGWQRRTLSFVFLLT